MRRLTVRNFENKACCAVGGCDAYEDCYECTGFQDILEKLDHYEELEEAGRLVVLPCKVGEIVWVSKNKEKTRMVLLDSIADILWYMEHGYGIGYTREEAEAALKGAE